MAGFVLQGFSTSSVTGNTSSPRVFSYISATDALATIIASAYFNAVVAHFQISDLIYVVGTDGAAFYKVTAITPDVTVMLFGDLADGTVTAAKLGALAVTTAKIDNLAVTTGKIALLAVDAAQLAALAVTTAKIAANAVTLAKLDSGITPSHVVKYAGKHTTTGGSATEAQTVTGVASTDIVIATLQDKGSTPRTILTTKPTTDTITYVFSGDPSTDHVVSYVVYRAAV